MIRPPLISFVRRTALATAALPLVLAGCTKDEPVPQSPDSTTTTHSPSATAAPEPWEEKSKEGATAFARHWVDLLNDVRLGADFSPFQEASAQSCETCTGVVEVFRRLNEPGGVYESKPWRVRNAVAISGPSGREAKVAIRIFVPVERVREPGDQAVQVNRATTETFEATLQWSGSTWLMRDLEVVQ